MALASKENALSQPENAALVDERTSVTWKTLDQITNRATNAMLALSATRVAIFAPNCMEVAVAHLGGLHAGVSTVPVNYHLTDSEVAYMLRVSGARAIFTGPENLAVALSASSMAGGVQVIAWRCRSEPGVVRWEEFIEGASASEPPTDLPARPHLHFTSGTTGLPKAVETPPYMFPRVGTVEDLFSERRRAVDLLGDRSPTLVVGPLYHAGPMASIRMLAAGKPIVLLSRFEPEATLSAIARHRIKSVMMVPTHFQRLLALPEAVRARYDVSSLTHVLHSGAACPPDVKRKMIAWFGPILTEVYGATEGGVVCSITSEEWLRKPGSVGRPLSTHEVIVVTEGGKRASSNERGQLYFRDKSGWRFEYLGSDAMEAEPEPEPGAFSFGEIGYVDDDGYVFITDRASDMIVSGGVNIYPAEVEQVLLRHADVDDVAVLGVPDGDLGEAVRALVVPRDPELPPSTADLDKFCRAHLAGFKCPRSYEFVGSVGRNAAGKINKRELRRRYWPASAGA